MDQLSFSKALNHEQFFRCFQQQVTALRASLKALDDQASASANDERVSLVNSVLSRIAQLSSEVNDASSMLPAHDQRNYAETIKSLSNELQRVRSTVTPKPKFSFRSGGKLSARKKLATSNTPLEPNPNSPSPGDAQPANLDHLNVRDGASPSTITAVPVQTPALTPNTMFITQRENRYIEFPQSTSIEAIPSLTTPLMTGTLSELKTCVVNFLSGASEPVTREEHRVLASGSLLAGLHLKNIMSSLLLICPISGAVHITGLQNSILVITTRQFRMHDSKNCDVYLQVQSKPIIENCTGIRFAPLPSILHLSTGNAQSDSNSKEEAHLDNGTWTDVDDFNWLRIDQPSPNWQLLPSDRRLANDVWERVIKEKDVGQILEHVKVDPEAQ